MADADPPRLMAGFSLAYAADGDEAAILGLHAPTPEQQAAGLTPHWEPLIIFPWDQVPSVLRMFLDVHADLSPIVERKRQLEKGELTAEEAWTAAWAEMRPGPQVL